MPPQTLEFLEKFEFASCTPDSVHGECARASFPSAKHEIEAAAKWARARLEEGKTRIGVVIPELSQHRSQVVRVFSRVMQPGYNLPGAARTPMPFNVSLGKPLSSFPLVHFALDLLELAFQSVEFSHASHLVRSPFLGRADTELARRGALDARLRKNADAHITLAEADRGRRTRAAAAQGAREGVRDHPHAARVARRMGAALLRAARGRRLPRRARARLRRVPDARQVARSARRTLSPGANRKPFFIQPGPGVPQALLRRHAVPARIARRADPGPRRARVGGPALRLPVGERPDRRGLAARRPAESLHPDRGAKESRHPAGERGSLGGARPAHYGRMEAFRRRSRLLLSAEGRGPRLRPFAPHSRRRREACRHSRLPALPRCCFSIQASRELCRLESSPRPARQGQGRHPRARRPGRMPVPRLRQVPPRRRAARGARARPRPARPRQADARAHEGAVDPR